MRDLADVKEGDVVALNLGQFSRRIEKVTVTRTTKTLLYVGDKAYQRDGGCERGMSASWSPDRLSAWREESDGPRLKAQIAADKLRQLRDYPWLKLDAERADKVLAILKAIPVSTPTVECNSGTGAASAREELP